MLALRGAFTGALPELCFRHGLQGEHHMQLSALSKLRWDDRTFVLLPFWKQKQSVPYTMHLSEIISDDHLSNNEVLYGSVL